MYPQGSERYRTDNAKWPSVLQRHKASGLPVNQDRACRFHQHSGTKDTVSIEINVMLQNGTQNIWIAHANKRTSFSSLQHAGLKFFEFIIDNSY